MAYRTVDIDDEVYAVLQRKAIPFVDTTPNDVLRRILLGEASHLRTGRTGDLMTLMDEGRLKAGDRLVHHQPRKRRTFVAQVTPDGYIELDDGRRFASPSPALKACIGTDINGWKHWIVERTEQPLQSLRQV
jgi:hypothetical protein